MMSHSSQRSHFSPIEIAVVMVGALALTAGIVLAEPSAVPPGNNTPPPVHTGTAAQTKNGVLTLNGLGIFGNARFGATGHLNWGTTGGQNGYGLRGSGGVMQYKNSGDASWTPFGTGVGTTFQQYGFTGTGESEQPEWSICAQPSLSNISCETYTAGNGWANEVLTGTTQSMWYKEIPGQSATPWTLCSLNGYTTPYDHGTAAYVVKKTNGKWYMYVTRLTDGIRAPGTTINCWR